MKVFMPFYPDVEKSFQLLTTIKTTTGALDSVILDGLASSA
jgi:hypothetical protein